MVISEILFYGKKNLPWDKVEQYEYKGSEDTRRTKGQYAKAKANAVQGIKEMITIARKTSETENLKDRNRSKAKHGWYRYLTRFALPIMKVVWIFGFK